MIIVVGATGNLGGAITRMLLAQGRSVRILARPWSTYRSLAEEGAQVIMGDLKERGSLDLACQGADTVITTANSVLRGGEDNIENVDLKGNQNLIDAAKQAGVKHFVFVSINSVDPNSPHPFVAAKGKTEEYLMGSGMPYTIIAPHAFMEVWISMVVGTPIMQGQPVTVMGNADSRHSFISAADVAAFAVAAVENPAALNQRLLLGGPEFLSFRDAAEIYGRILKCPVEIRVVDFGAPVPGLPESVLPLLPSFAMPDTPIEMTDLARSYGIQLTSLEQVVHRMIASAIPA